MSDDRADSDDRAVKGEPISEPAASEPDETAGSVSSGPRRMVLLVAVAVVVLGLDLLTKVLAVAFIDPKNPVEIIGDTVTLTLIRNPGAAFSMATGMTWLLTLVAVGVVIGVIKIGRTLSSPWWALGLGLVLGGALGNLIDRIFRSPGPLQGHVVDFVSVGWWPVFNVADSSIVCGAILLVALTLFGIEPSGVKTSGKGDAA
ncbi:signal peptidase II [Rhodococcus sp. LBL1]|uniref:Lipoprotein signal peptidase n=1 Tax=Prescottella agglutinans TaxID=1644129 RepID=A0ABT6M6W7_9NOCA|nr:signal peptidase II [Prescottella agglutinans]MDH6678129.1 signal peptidase II [Rhodococcus sp. LBL1]MDH6683716.1 signal peptidase II [Rhodococcus sp. LBL2]